jgi:hypothetical protein
MQGAGLQMRDSCCASSALTVLPQQPAQLHATHWPAHVSKPQHHTSDSETQYAPKPKAIWKPNSTTVVGPCNTHL